MKGFMNIYLVSRTDNVGYDEYIAFVVCAKNKKQARIIIKNEVFRPYCTLSTWSDSNKIIKIGTTHYKKPKIILDSFNAG